MKRAVYLSATLTLFGAIRRQRGMLVDATVPRGEAGDVRQTRSILPVRAVRPCTGPAAQTAASAGLLGDVADLPPAGRQRTHDGCPDHAHALHLRYGGPACRQHDGCSRRGCSQQQLQLGPEHANAAMRRRHRQRVRQCARGTLDRGPWTDRWNADLRLPDDGEQPGRLLVQPDPCPNSNYTFDTSSCSCVCNPQTCSGNFVFSQAACGCVCEATSCPTNYVWDDNSCGCLCNPSPQAVTDCTSMGGTFNSTNCSCVTSTVCFSTGCQSGWCGSQTDNCGLSIDCGPCGGGGGGGGGGGDCAETGEECSSGGDCCNGNCDGTRCIETE